MDRHQFSSKLDVSRMCWKFGFVINRPSENPIIAKCNLMIRSGWLKFIWWFFACPHLKLFFEHNIFWKRGFLEIFSWEIQNISKAINRRNYYFFNCKLDSTKTVLEATSFHPCVFEKNGYSWKCSWKKQKFSRKIYFKKVFEKNSFSRTKECF